MSRWVVKLALTALQVASLHAEDQTHVRNRAENPIKPSQDFLHYLQYPASLAYFDTPERHESHQAFLDHLKDNGHKVEVLVGAPLENLDEIDSLFIFAQELPGQGSELAIRKFVDRSWYLPPSLNGQNLRDTNLPPSLFIAAPPSSSMGPRLNRLLKSLGFQFDKGAPPPTANNVKLSQHGRSLLQDIAISNFTGTFHQIDKKNPFVLSLIESNAPKFYDLRHRLYDFWAAAEIDDLLSPKLSSRKVEAVSSAVSLMQADLSWSRVVVSSFTEICSELSSTCQRLIDWVTHRSHVATWANLQHYRISKPHTWSEYEGDLVKTDWSKDDLQAVDLSQPYLYRIRDELLIAVDLYKLARSIDGKFIWNPSPTPSLEVEYVMMVPYVRKLMIPFDSNYTQATPLMTAWLNNPTALRHTPLQLHSATHWIHFKAPRQHGIFKLQMKRLQHELDSRILMETVMPLRTYKHDEDPRFVRAAYPFYCSLIVGSAGFGLVCIVWPWYRWNDCGMVKKD